MVPNSYHWRSLLGSCQHSILHKCRRWKWHDCWLVGTISTTGASAVKKRGSTFPNRSKNPSRILNPYILSTCIESGLSIVPRRCQDVNVCFLISLKWSNVDRLSPSDPAFLRSPRRRLGTQVHDAKISCTYSIVH